MKYLKRFEDIADESIFLNINRTKEFIYSGGDINSIVSDENDTPLLIASFHHKLDVVIELIKCGANWNSVNDYGHNFLDYLDSEEKIIISKEFPDIINVIKYNL